MATPPISPEEHARRLKAYEEAGGNIRLASELAKMSYGGYQSWTLKHGLKGKGVAHTPTVEQAAPELSRAEVHDASFWKKQFTTLSKQIGEAEHLIEELTGVRNIPYRVPDFLNIKDTGPKGKSVVCALVSDVHMGEVISAEEILGINAFDEKICRDRIRRYFHALCHLGARWSEDTDCEGAFIAFAGDLISGDIHEELRLTNSLTAHEQVQAMVEECSYGIRLLKQVFGKVHVVFVPGNHGRTTHKPTAKLYSRLSYDMLIGAIVQKSFENDPNVTFQMSAAKDQMVPIFRRTVFVTHGDKIGTRGGMGFAGPMLPIIRGTKKIEAQQASIGRRADIILHGHYHTTGNPGNVLSNGSVPGYSEYGDDLRAVIEPPQQWGFLMHSKWGLRERMPIQLEEPALPEKPRVRVPANWGTV